MPAGVFLGFGRESALGARSVGTSRPAARSGLFGHDDGARATVLAGLRATTGTLDHTGGAVGHRTGPAGNNRGAGTLTTGDDRWDDRRAADRPAVAGADATRGGNVRGPGETARLGLVGVGTLVRVTTTAFLTPGEALASGAARRAAAGDVLGAALTRGRHESM
ncbi:hypothetical protein Q0Z83_107560 [Actinoplanes sichuanensis]|uniref:Uncharacterized protein n=1 Tax=Actinoplanes sichuanensis TaxID=512349 RepID=A0ABW4AL67_9ACTN|nr:hypothetical protein [Actinoplanes sichuanensis]BEL12565.1 hypothetical protein Q0Z83_107560 [Actinoplanes sichuanensis]